MPHSSFTAAGDGPVTHLEMGSDYPAVFVSAPSGVATVRGRNDGTNQQYKEFLPLVSYVVLLADGSLPQAGGGGGISIYTQRS